VVGPTYDVLLLDLFWVGSSVRVHRTARVRSRRCSLQLNPSSQHRSPVRGVSASTPVPSGPVLALPMNTKPTRHDGFTKTGPVLCIQPRLICFQTPQPARSVPGAQHASSVACITSVHSQTLNSNAKRRLLPASRSRIRTVRRRNHPHTNPHRHVRRRRPLLGIAPLSISNAQDVCL
jgi:hypothetical protein